MGDTLTDVLRGRGFPVQSDGDSIDDTTAAHLKTELAAVASSRKEAA
jgi:hypothetical protein